MSDIDKKLDEYDSGPMERTAVERVLTKAGHGQTQQLEAVLEEGGLSERDGALAQQLLRLSIRLDAIENRQTRPA